MQSHKLLVRVLDCSEAMCAGGKRLTNRRIRRTEYTPKSETANDCRRSVDHYRVVSTINTRHLKVRLRSIEFLVNERQFLTRGLHGEDLRRSGMSSTRVSRTIQPPTVKRTNDEDVSGTGICSGLPGMLLRAKYGLGKITKSTNVVNKHRNDKDWAGRYAPENRIRMASSLQ